MGLYIKKPGHPVDHCSYACSGLRREMALNQDCELDQGTGTKVTYFIPVLVPNQDKFKSAFWVRIDRLLAED